LAIVAEMSGRCSNRELILEGAKPKSGPGAGIPSGATNPFGGFLPAAAIMRMEAGSEESTHHSGCSFPSKGPSRGSWGPREGVLPGGQPKRSTVTERHTAENGSNFATSPEVERLPSSPVAVKGRT